MDILNTRLVMGLALLVLGILVLLVEGFLRVGVGVGFIIVGLLIALQNASGNK